MNTDDRLGAATARPRHSILLRPAAPGPSPRRRSVLARLSYLSNRLGFLAGGPAVGVGIDESTGWERPANCE